MYSTKDEKCKGLNEVKSQTERLNGATSDVSRTGASYENATTIKCQNIFLDILHDVIFINIVLDILNLST